MNIKEIEFAAKSGIESTLDYASNQLGWQLPRDCRHCCYMTALKGQIYSLTELLEILLVDSKFYGTVDLAVRGIVDGQTLIAWLPVGLPEVENMEETFNQGNGPFKVAGIMSPREDFHLSHSELLNMGSKWMQNEQP